MRIYLMTDLEGVAGVANFQDWAFPGQLHYPVARQLLTQEVNAAVDGFFAGGATEIVVSDAHGPSAVNITELDPRADYMRGWADQTFPLNLDASYDAVAWVGQHARACTPYGHLCHTQSLDYIDESVNGVSIGEFGELALCAAELGVRVMFGAGDQAFTHEARALVPGLETVAVKRGLKAVTGADLAHDAYMWHVGSAVHLHPQRARAAIREGARRAAERARRDPAYGRVAPLEPPFERVIVFRPGPHRATRTRMRVSHPASFIEVMNLHAEEAPIADDER